MLENYVRILTFKVSFSETTAYDDSSVAFSLDHLDIGHPICCNKLEADKTR